MPVAPQFRRLLSDLLERSEASQESVATALGVKRQTLYNWANGKTRPSRDDAQRIAQYFAVPLTSVWVDEAPISVRERARLTELEDFARRVQAMLDEIRPAPGPEPEGEAVDAQPQVVYREEGGVVREVPRKRRAKGA